MRSGGHLQLERRPLILALTVLVAIAGCEDPSNVGLGVIGESGSDPVRVRVEATGLPANVSPPVTSGIRTSLGFTTGASRVLAGTVDDPLFGTIKTTAYVDVAPSTSQSADFRSGTITAVELALKADYAYGDTLATTSMILSQMDTDWGTTTMTSDTVLTAGPEIIRQDFSYGDSLLIFELPEAWYTAHSAQLLSANVVDDFNGFQLETSGSSVILGFDGTSGFLRIVTTTGTADLVVSKLFTHVERGNDLVLPSGRSAIQDGLGHNLSMHLNFQADSVKNSAISRAVVELTVDSAAMNAVPANFYRPLPIQYDLLGVKQDGSSILLRTGLLTGNTIRFVSNTAAAGQVTLIRAIQQAATGNDDYVAFRVQVDEVEAAVNSILIFGTDAEQSGPAAILTLTPNSF